MKRNFIEGIVKIIGVKRAEKIMGMLIRYEYKKRFGKAYFAKDIEREK